MGTDDTVRDELEAISADVRLLAADVHRVLTAPEATEHGRHEEDLAVLEHRADDLLHRVGEDRLGDGRLYGLRRWLQSLQRRVVVMRWLTGSLDDHLGIARGDRAGLIA